MNYRFKKWISTSEAVEVMKIIKYTKDGWLISQESYDAYPELQSYFEPADSTPPATAERKK